MTAIPWTVFLTFIAVSAAANYAHGDDRLAGALMAVVPVGFAAVIFLVESMVARGKGSWPLFLAAGVVGIGAGVASYVGLATMALDHGVPAIVAYLLPLAYDGVVAVASLAIRGLGSDHMNLDQPIQVTHHQNPIPLDQEMDRTPLASLDRPVAQAAPIQAAAASEPAPIQVDRPAVDRPETAAQTPIQRDPDPSVEVARDVPAKVDRAKPRSTRRPAQKAKPIQGGSDAEKAKKVDHAIQLIQDGMSERDAAEQAGVSRGAIQREKRKRSTEGKPAEQALTEEEVARLSETDLDEEFANLLKPNDET